MCLRLLSRLCADVLDIERESGHCCHPIRLVQAHRRESIGTVFEVFDQHPQPVKLLGIIRHYAHASVHDDRFVRVCALAVAVASVVHHRRASARIRRDGIDLSTLGRAVEVQTVRRRVISVAHRHRVRAVCSCKRERAKTPFAQQAGYRRCVGDLAVISSHVVGHVQSPLGGSRHRVAQLVVHGGAS